MKIMMKSIKSLLSIVSCTFGSSVLLCLPALADQCAYITKDQAMMAISRLELEQTIYLLCEPCGDKIIQSTKIESLSLETVDYQDYWQVTVNNRGIDLAYVFVDSGIENNLVNLAAVSDCNATRVSLSIPKNSFRFRDKVRPNLLPQE